MKKLTILAALIIVTFALLWFGQFRYAWNPIIEQDRFVGVSYAFITQWLGKPGFETTASRKGYEVEPQTDFNRLVVYNPLWGKLLLYFKDGNCVGSVFFTRNAQF